MAVKKKYDGEYQELSAKVNKVQARMIRLKAESDSISNQRALLTQYLTSRPEFSGCEPVRFVDDGYNSDGYKDTTSGMDVVMKGKYRRKALDYPLRFLVRCGCCGRAISRARGDKKMEYFQTQSLCCPK